MQLRQIELFSLHSREKSSADAIEAVEIRPRDGTVVVLYVISSSAPQLIKEDLQIS